MDPNKSFTEKDYQNQIDFLNWLNNNAKFEVDVDGLIKGFGYFSWAQKQLLPKVKSHIFEVKNVVEPEPEAKQGFDPSKG
jgi:hypothetical protein